MAPVKGKREDYHTREQPHDGKVVPDVPDGYGRRSDLETRRPPGTHLSPLDTSRAPNGNSHPSGTRRSKVDFDLSELLRVPSRTRNFSPGQLEGHLSWSVPENLLLHE